ncbi:hypothetical protein D3C71_1919970 [compost metagenome]
MALVLASVRGMPDASAALQAALDSSCCSRSTLAMPWSLNEVCTICWVSESSVAALSMVVQPSTTREAVTAAAVCKAERCFFFSMAWSP